jgi:Glycosyl hydrolases family 43/Carbohydrate binding module (family 6)
VLMDKDGTAYIFWARGRISVAKLKENMLELDGPPLVITNLPFTGLIEGPFPFERNGIYYLTYPHVQNKIERLEYATSTNPMGPYKPAGVILDEAASGCWTVHQSIVEYKGQWYLFYHDKDLSPQFDKNRAIRADKLFFNEDGTIQKVNPTLRGVGIVDAKSKIQIDRYSAISKEGVTVSFLDATNTFAGWKIALDGKNTWVQFDQVEFGQSGLKSVNVRSASSTGGLIEIRLDKADGPLVARVEIGKDAEWKVIEAKLQSVPTGTHNLFVIQNENNQVDLDWIRFE